MSIVIATQPNIPFISSPLILQFSDIIRVLGKISSYGKRLTINLQHGNQTSIVDDVPLHIDFRPVEENCVVRNTYQNNRWGIEERDGGSPIKVDEFFELLIQIGPDKFRIAINGTHFCEYKYRLPINLAKFLQIYHDANISTVSIEKYGISLIKFPNVEIIYNEFPLIMPIGREGLYPGRQILIYGRPTFNAQRISINLQNTDTKNLSKDFSTLIAFHMSIRFTPNKNNSGIIVLNTFKGHWLLEERIHDFPFGRNQNYTICIWVKNDNFHVEINNKQISNFKFRAPLYECKYLYICGDTTVKATV